MNLKWLRLSLLLVILTGAIIHYFSWWPKIDKNHLAFYNNQGQTTFQGLVIKEPDRRANHVKLTVEAPVVGIHESPLLRGRVLVNSYLYPEYQYGDLLEITCRLKTPEPVEDFAYDKYLAKFKIYSLCYQPKIKLIEKNRGNRLYGKILQLKNKLAKIIDSSLPIPHSALLKAILLGQKKEIPQDLLNKFSRVGISHIIAISGMHITIITAILFNFFLAIGIRRKISFYLIAASLILFVTMIGFPASAVRASIMGIINLLAMQVGRLNKSSWSLILTATIMLAINPLLLFYDVGFQLSFMAVLGIMKLSNKIEIIWQRLKLKIPTTLGIRESLTMTLAAQITTLPLIIYHFGQASLISPLANILILPLLPIIMILGFSFTLVGLISLSLTRVLFWFEWLILSYLIKVVEIFTSWQWTAVTELKVGWWFLIICYLLFPAYVCLRRTLAGRVIWLSWGRVKKIIEGLLCI